MNIDRFVKLSVFLISWVAAVTAAGQTSRFILNGGEAYDSKTGLSWKRCIYGLTWNGRTCVGQAQGVTWFDAMAMQDGTWRVPNIQEMQTLFVDRAGYPKLDVEAFPDAAGHPEIQYWTSSKLTGGCLENGNRACSQIVMFNGEGGPYTPFGGTPGIFHNALRMVRGGSELRPLNSAANGTQTAAGQTKTVRQGRWVLRGGEAYDTTTHLTWQRCNADLRYGGDLGCQGVPREYTFTEARQLEGRGWRLPTAKELETIFYHGQLAPGMPRLDPEVFSIDPNHTVYWSTTPSTPNCPTCQGPHCDWTCEHDANGQWVSKGVFCGYYDLSGTMACQKTELKVARLVRADKGDSTSMERDGDLQPPGDHNSQTYELVVELSARVRREVTIVVDGAQRARIQAGDTVIRVPVPVGKGFGSKKEMEVRVSTSDYQLFEGHVELQPGGRTMLQVPVPTRLKGI